MAEQTPNLGLPYLGNDDTLKETTAVAESSALAIEGELVRLDERITNEKTSVIASGTGSTKNFKITRKWDGKNAGDSHCPPGTFNYNPAGTGYFTMASKNDAGEHEIAYHQLLEDKYGLPDVPGFGSSKTTCIVSVTDSSGKTWTTTGVDTTFYGLDDDKSDHSGHVYFQNTGFSYGDDSGAGETHVPAPTVPDEEYTFEVTFLGELFEPSTGGGMFSPLVLEGELVKHTPIDITESGGGFVNEFPLPHQIMVVPDSKGRETFPNYTVLVGVDVAAKSFGTHMSSPVVTYSGGTPYIEVYSSQEDGYRSFERWICFDWTTKTSSATVDGSDRLYWRYFDVKRLTYSDPNDPGHGVVRMQLITPSRTELASTQPFYGRVWNLHAASNTPSNTHTLRSEGTEGLHTRIVFPQVMIPNKSVWLA